MIASFKYFSPLSTGIAIIIEEKYSWLMIFIFYIDNEQNASVFYQL
jgi:hypothetical protein